MNHEMVDGIQKRRSLFTVDYTGFGWVMIKNGVFEDERDQVSLVPLQRCKPFESGSCSGYVW